IRVEWPAFPSSNQLHALTTVGQFACLAALFGVGWLWRRGRRTVARLVSVLFLAAFVVTTLGMPLGATRLYLFGISVDQQFRTEYLTRLTDSPALHDMTYAGLPPFYPPGWFWIGGRAAALTGNAPNLGEFSLEVDVSRADVGGLSAGLGAKNEGSRVVMRRSDFRPAADFVLDLIDAKSRKGDRLEAYRSDSDGVRYFLAEPVLDPGPPPEQLDMVLVVDVSAATDEARLDLGRAAAQALLQQLRPQDRVAVLAASTTSSSLGREAMGPASKERVEELIGLLAKQTPAGASNLEGAFMRAVELLPRGKGTVIYIGDGRPTVGALLPGELRDRLARLGALPRFYAVAVGTDANLDLL
ncbi:arabinofuranosyltransferase, partial [Haliangium sp. UPWRP_2]|uniref:arabinofuranosyltransferase n=1 Tax=Haliangium sp. UPWRP_2 TaxID=1931276 RepID=UPI0011B20C41